MDRDEKMKEAQEILNWAIIHSNLSINCKMMPIPTQCGH
jgi:hypothetical protein